MTPKEYKILHDLVSDRITALNITLSKFKRVKRPALEAELKTLEELHAKLHQLGGIPLPTTIYKRF